MMKVRLTGFSPWVRRRIRKILNTSELKIIFGCGETSYVDWIGIDGVKGKGVTLRLDLRRNLPFSNGCAKHCYSEHFLEHLTPIEGLQHLSEVHRVLMPGGRYRIVVPAAKRFMERYIANDLDFFSLAFPWAESPLDATYHIVNWNGAHRNIFNHVSLVQLGKQAGLEEVIPSSANCSELPVLRIDRNEPQRIAESIYVEMIKAGDDH